MSETKVRRINGLYDVNILINNNVYYYDTDNKKVELGKPSSCNKSGCVYESRALGGGVFHLFLGGHLTLYYDKDASSTTNASSTKNASGKKRRNPKSNKIRKTRKPIKRK